MRRKLFPKIGRTRGGAEPIQSQRFVKVVEKDRGDGFIYIPDATARFTLSADMSFLSPRGVTVVTLTSAQSKH